MSGPWRIDRHGANPREIRSRRLTFAVDRRNWKTLPRSANMHHPREEIHRERYPKARPDAPRSAEDVRPGRRGVRAGRTGRALRPRRRKQHHSAGPGRLRRPRQRRRRGRPGQQKRPHQARRPGRRLPQQAQGEGRELHAQLRQAGRPPQGSPVSRLRRLQARHGLSEAGRRGHPDDAAGVSLGPLHLRHLQGTQRLHGEADHGGRARPRGGC